MADSHEDPDFQQRNHGSIGPESGFRPLRAELLTGAEMDCGDTVCQNALTVALVDHVSTWSIATYSRN